MGIEFDVIRGKGPKITEPIRTAAQVDSVAARIKAGLFSPDEVTSRRRGWPAHVRIASRRRGCE